MSTQDNLTIFDRQSTKDGSPIAKTFTLGYDSITNAVLKIQLLADTPFLNIYGWKLTKVDVNGNIFYPNSAQDTSILIQDVNNVNTSLRKVLNPNGNNTISINFDAPIGAGVISQSAQINAQLLVTGSKSISGSLGLNNLPSSSDIISNISNFFKDNTPVAIAILILIAVIIVALAYLSSKVPALPKLPDIKGVKKLVR